MENTDMPEISDNITRLIQNSDFLHKKDVDWVKDIDYQEPNNFEKEMLENTKTPIQLIKEEQEETIVLKTEEELKQEKNKNLILMIKIITADRLGYHPLYNLSTLQPSQATKFKGIMEGLINDYNNGFSEDITKEFNTICCEKLFQCGADVSQYPIYR